MPSKPNPLKDQDRLDPRELLRTLRSFKRGDFSVRLPIGLAGLDGQIADVLNELIE